MPRSCFHLAAMAALLLSICQPAFGLKFSNLYKKDKTVVLVANNPVLKQLDPLVFKNIAQENHLVIFNRAELWQQLGSSLTSYTISFYSPNTIEQFGKEVKEDLIPAACGASKIIVLKGEDVLEKAFKDVAKNPALQIDPPLQINKRNFYDLAIWTAQLLIRCGNFDPNDRPPELTYSKTISVTLPRRRSAFATSGFTILGYYLAKDTPELTLLGFNSTAPGYNGSRGHYWEFETQVINFLAEVGRLKLLYNTY